MSQSSRKGPDPLSDVLSVLGAKVARRTRMEAAGEWALSFSAIDQLKFVALLRGEKWVLLPGQPPQLQREGDVCLLGRTDYAVASHFEVDPIDGHALFEGPEGDFLRINGNDVIAIGGTITFCDTDADFLLDMLPSYMPVPRNFSASGAIATVLDLINNEVGRDAIGSEIVSSRLADILVVEAIRAYAQKGDEGGWLGALADRRIGRTLRAMHGDIAYPWTVGQLAGVAGMSRAAFSAEFTRKVGKPPLAYLRSWRLTTARSLLSRGDKTVENIANEVGYTSQSAFGHAFRRAFSTSPKTDSQTGQGAIRG